MIDRLPQSYHPFLNFLRRLDGEIQAHTILAVGAIREEVRTRCKAYTFLDGICDQFIAGKLAR